MKSPRFSRLHRVVLAALVIVLLTFCGGILFFAANSRPAEIRMDPGYVTNHPDGGRPMIVHEMPLPPGKLLLRPRPLGALVSFVELRTSIETNSGDGQWHHAPNLPSGVPGASDQDRELIWTPIQDTDAQWRLRIDYTQSIHFQNKHIVTLRRAVIHSPPWPGRSTNPPAITK